MPLDPVEICPDEDELLALLSGSSRDAERVRSHLDDCSDCATVVARLLQPERRRSALGRARAPGQHVDRYLLLQPLGQGAMGMVWLARDPRLRRRVALKLVRVGARAEHVGRRLRHEAQALARVVDPHVTAVFDVGTDGDDVFIAMEHVAGGTLRAWSNAAPRRWRELLPVFRQAALGLAAAHRAGLVHRDFKPENVLVELDPHEPAAPPRVRVADFGLAWAARAALDDGDDAPEQRTDALLTTAAGTPSGTHRLVGTPAYMAPEQFAASRVDARTDQFALCVALYEALCGRRPFAGDDLEALRQAVLEREPAPLPRGCAPRWLRALVHRGLARDPSRRHADMDAIAVALARGHARRGPLLLPLGAALLAAPWLLPVRGGGVARCEDRPQPAAAVTTALRDRIAALDDGTATAVAAVAQRRLDDYAAALHELDLSVCETQRDADDTAAARARACVDAAAREFDATVETLATMRGSSERVPALLERLPALSRCRDDARLARDGASTPTTDPAIAAVDRRIAAARALAASARVTEAEPIARAAWLDALALDDAGLRARARMAVALAIDPRSHADEAGALLEAVAADATALGDDALLAAAHTQLVYLRGHVTAEPLRAREHARHAMVALERGDDDPLGRLEVERLLAQTELDAGTAIEVPAQRLAAAIAQAEPRVDPASDVFVAALYTLASIEQAAGDYDASERASRRAIAEVEQRIGPMHGALVPPLSTLAITLLMRGDGAAALPILHRALAIQAATAGMDQVDAAVLLSQLALAFELLGAPQAAVDAATLALTTLERRSAPEYVELARTSGTLGRLLAGQARWDEAEAALGRALAAVEANYGVDHVEYAAYLYMLGDAVRMRGEPDRALPMLQRARAIYRAQHADDHPDALAIDIVTAAALLDAGRHDQAVTLLTALWHDNPAPSDPSLRGDIAMYLAQARWQRGERGPELVALAREAATLLRAREPEVAAELDAEIARWLAATPPG